MTTVEQLNIWIEQQLPVWNERGVDALKGPNNTSILGFSQTLQAGAYYLVVVGRIWACHDANASVEEFVCIGVDEQMGLEHCKVLIENAVDQVAGR